MAGEAAEVEGVKSNLGKVVAEVAKEMGQEDLRKFASFFTDVDRIEFLLKLKVTQDILKVHPDYKKKNAVESKKMREEGNKLFAKKKFREALQKFNNGVCLAPFHSDSQSEAAASQSSHMASEELLMALGNRSAALQFLKFYELCIRDIDLAVEWGFPSDQLYKLWDRKGKCLSHLGRKAEAIDYFKRGVKSLSNAKLDEKGVDIWTKNFDKQIKEMNALSEEQIKRRQQAAKTPRIELPKVTDKPNHKFENANSSFGISMTNRLGRQVIAKEEIMIGDIIAVEKPMSSVLYASAYGVHCYNCFTYIKATIPCKSCSSVSFCSVSCQKEAWGKYHKVECKYMSWMSDLWATRLGHLALRITLTTPYKTLREYFGKNKFEYTKPDLMSGFDDGGVYHSNYQSLFTLVTNGDLRLPEDLMPFSLIAIMMLKVLKENNTYWSQAQEFGDTREEAELLVAISLMHHIQIVQCNAMTVSVMNMTGDFRDCQPLDIGLGIYPTIGLMNHSCDPNVEVTFYGCNSVAVAVRDIKPGEPVVNHYSMCYYTTPKKERQIYYQTQFYFNCQCEACTNNWPLWDEIECSKPTLLCGKCGGDMPTTKPLVIDCPHCGHTQDIGEILYKLQVSHDLYSMAMKDVFKGHVDAALPVLEEHLRLMLTYIKRPWRDMVSCIATLKQIYNIRAYMYSFNQ